MTARRSSRRIERLTDLSGVHDLRDLSRHRHVPQEIS
jgi:hypothetical protein